jgi:hypothetical protein
MEAALYVLQSRLLIELLIREYRRQGEFLGRGEQARVLAHEVAQVSQLLGVGAPRSGRLVWDGKTMEAFLAGLPADEREQVKLGSVFCPLGHVYEAAVNYIDTISDAKTVQTPFDDYCDAPFFEVLQKLTEFGKKAVFAHWVRRQLRTIEGIDSLHEAMKLQSQFSEALSKTETFRIVDRLAGLDVRMPPSGLKCIQRSGGAPHEFGEGRRKIYVWIAKLVVAAFMSTLKFATNVDPGEDPLPVVVVASAKLDPPEVTILVANRLPDDEESIVASSSSQETGTRLVLKVLADNMERAAFKNVAVRFERATTEELENPDIGVLRRPGTKDDAFCTSISFQGIAAEVLLRQGRLIAD